MELLDDLENYRKANDISPDQMAELFGLSTRQNYDNWVRRKSIPKSYVEKAKEILGYQDKLTKVEKEILSIWRSLPNESKKIVLTQFKALRPPRS